MVEPFASVYELPAQARQGVDAADAQAALDTVSGAIRSYCHWVVSREVVTGAKLSPAGRRRVWLPTMALVSVEAVVEDGVTLAAGVDFDFDSTGLLLRAGRWTTTMNGLLVSYTHGYAFTDWQLQAVRGVCLSAAARHVGNPGGHRSETRGPFSWTVGGSGDDAGSPLTAADHTVLDPFVVDTVA